MGSLECPVRTEAYTARKLQHSDKHSNQANKKVLHSSRKTDLNCPVTVGSSCISSKYGASSVQVLPVVVPVLVCELLLVSVSLEVALL
jgi:hypothetical protein